MSRTIYYPNAITNIYFFLRAKLYTLIPINLVPFFMAYRLGRKNESIRAISLNRFFFRSYIILFETIF